MENIIHKMLKYGWCIGKTAFRTRHGHFRYDFIFKVSIPCPKYGLPFVAFLDANQIIGFSKINLCINLCLAKLIKKSRNTVVSRSFWTLMTIHI